MAATAQGSWSSWLRHRKQLAGVGSGPKTATQRAHAAGPSSPAGGADSTPEDPAVSVSSLAGARRHRRRYVG
jgi:hypothetical protein